tara:strand:+ start:279 stop:566 length:288 start_codon:yes stop_codon:yes gene_type:complete
VVVVLLEEQVVDQFQKVLMQLLEQTQLFQQLLVQGVVLEVNPHFKVQRNNQVNLVVLAEAEAVVHREDQVEQETLLQLVQLKDKMVEQEAQPIKL